MTPNRSYTKTHWFLLSSLMAVVGFSISWNPENTQIARYEVKPGQTVGEAMFASTGSQATDLKGLDIHIPVEGGTPVVTRNGKKQKNVDGKWVDVEETNATSDEIAELKAKIAKLEKGKDVAETTTEGVVVHEIEFKDSDKLKGLKADVMVNKRDKKITYRLKGTAEGRAANTCVGCLNSQTLTGLSSSELENVKAIGFLVSESADRLVSEKTNSKDDEKESRLARERREKREKDKEEIEDSKCYGKGKDKDSRMECQKDEFLAKVKKCESMNEKKEKECFRAAETYYRKYLKASLTRGLAAGADSDSLDNAASVRDDLISELEDTRFDAIKRDLVNMTKNGTLMRAKNVYDSCLMGGSMMMGVGSGGCSPGMAAIQAKQSMMKELSNSTDSVGGRLRESLLNSGSESPLMQSLYMTNFQKPLYDFWQRDSRNGIAANEWGLNGIEGLGVAALGQPGLAPTDLLDVRANGQRGIRQVPNAFGNPRQGGAGVPAVPGAQFGNNNGFGYGPNQQQQFQPNGFQQNGFQQPGFQQNGFQPNGFQPNGPGAYNPNQMGPNSAPNISGFGPTYNDQFRTGPMNSIPNTVPTGPTGSRTRY